MGLSSGPVPPQSLLARLTAQGSAVVPEAVGTWLPELTPHFFPHRLEPVAYSHA